MKKVIMFICVSLFLFSCNNGTTKVEETEESTTAISCDGIGLVKLVELRSLQRKICRMIRKKLKELRRI